MEDDKKREEDNEGDRRDREGKEADDEEMVGTRRRSARCQYQDSLGSASNCRLLKRKKRHPDDRPDRMGWVERVVVGPTDEGRG